MIYDLITVGRVNMDLFAQDIGAGFADVSGFDAAVGGSPTNIAMGARRLGLASAAFTAVGDDTVGEFVLRFLADMGVVTDYVVTKEGKRTSLALLAVQPPDRFPLTFYRDDPADIHLTVADAAALPYGDTRAVLLSGDAFSRGSTADAVRLIAEMAADHDISVYMDLDLRPSEWSQPNAFGTTLRPVLPRVDVLIGTEEEFFALLAPDPGPVATGARVTASDRDVLERMVAALLEEGTVGTAVIKRGAAGATVVTADARLEVPAYTVAPVNTVGAGDAFAAGLIRSRLDGEDWYRSCRIANACGAIVVTRHGCSVAFPTLDEVTRFVAGSEASSGVPAEGVSGRPRAGAASPVNPPVLTPGKARGLATTSSAEGIFRVLAVDHRDSMRVEISPEEPEAVSEAILTDVKLDLLRRLGCEATAVMLDPEYSIAQAILTKALPGSVGFLAAIEAQGYLGDPSARTTALLEGWSVEKAKRVGASAVKLLVLYRPDAGAATDQQDALIARVIADCRRHDIPLFLEPLPYRLDGQESPNSPDFAAIRRRVVIDTVTRLGALGPEVLKVPFPVDTQREADRSAWSDACAELDEAACVPWVLLSGGDPYELFRDQVQVACEAGASGFLVGRALWRDFVSASPEQKDRVMKHVIRPRFAELSQLAVEHGRDWTELFTFDQATDRWYLGY